MKAYKILVKWSLKNGRFRMWSDDVPGLNLEGADVPALLDDAAKAIAVLLELNVGFDVVTVYPLLTLDGELLQNFRWYRKVQTIEYVVTAGIK